MPRGLSRNLFNRGIAELVGGLEVGQAFDEKGNGVRSGHHCAQPILRRFGVEATVRPSLAFYNTCDEVDALVLMTRRLSSRR